MDWDRLAVSVFRWIWHLQDTEQEGPRGRLELERQKACPRLCPEPRPWDGSPAKGIHGPLLRAGGLSPGRALERLGHATLAAIQDPPCSA